MLGTIGYYRKFEAISPFMVPREAKLKKYFSILLDNM